MTNETKRIDIDEELYESEESLPDEDMTERIFLVDEYGNLVYADIPDDTEGETND